MTTILHFHTPTHTVYKYVEKKKMFQPERDNLQEDSTVEAEDYYRHQVAVMQVDKNHGTELLKNTSSST